MTIYYSGKWLNPPGKKTNSAGADGRRGETIQSGEIGMLYSRRRLYTEDDSSKNNLIVFDCSIF